MTIFRLIILFFSLMQAAAGTASTAQNKQKNAVAGHDSPYLAMHGTDPVNWLPWDKNVLEQARQQDKLIFMSVGYFSCYWCHVMQNESFIDKDVAQVLNKYFVPVIVDRELNPALDAHLVTFMEQYRGSAGWPMNIFLTPEGYPLIGSLYAPKAQFMDLLVKLVARWQSDGDKLKVIARQAFDRPSHELTTEPGIKKGVGSSFDKMFVQDAMQFADITAGGFGEQSKFPMPSQLLALLEHYARTEDKDIKEFLLLTLDQMATQGLRDHLDGGFFRYTVDPTWKIPHFEKMLYDNALLSTIYMRAAEIFQNTQYSDVARDTLTFLARHFTSELGAMYSSFSAVDNHGIEGAYYTWTNEQLDSLLAPEERKIISFAWSMYGPYPIDEGYIPISGYTRDEIAAFLKMERRHSDKLYDDARQKLRQARQQRSLPIDSKLLASWNGLALSAFSRGARLFKEPAYRQTANKIRDYIITTLWDGSKLNRASSASITMRKGKLDDYAFVAEGLYEYALLTGDKEQLLLTRKILNSAWSTFFDKTGWHLNDDLLLPIESGKILIDDGALPSASATLVKVSLQIAGKLKDNTLRERALGALNNGYKLIESSPFAYAGTISVLASVQASQEKTSGNE